MAERYQPPSSCSNMNHSRANSPVRFCPQCSGVVNEAVPIKRCTDTAHATLRRRQMKFCIDCGVALVVSP
ncbi:MAG: hypothetical protein AB1689_21715 [Thermodesulfobacteriota bacterium]